MKRKTAAALSIIFALHSSQLSATEYWAQYYSDSFSTGTGTQITATCVFKNKVYSYSNNMNALRYTKDGKTWEIATSPSPASGEGIVNSMTSHNNALYVTERILGGNPFSVRISRSIDGNSWAVVRVIPNQGLAWVVEPYSYGDHLYIGLADGTIERTNGNTTPLTWEKIGATAPPQLTGRMEVKFFELQGNLYAFSCYTLNNIGKKEIYRLKSDNSWEQVGTFDFILQGTFNPQYLRLVHHDGWLYLNYLTGIWRSRMEGKLPYKWERVPDGIDTKDTSTKRAVQDVFGVLHLFVAFQPPKVLNAQGKWEPCFPERAKDFFSLLQLENRIFLFTGPVVGYADEMWTLDKGIRDVNYKPLPAGTAFSGQSGVALLGMGIQANVSDSLTLTVRNIGTASQGGSISAVHLVKSSPSGSARTFTNPVALTPDPADNKKWSLTAPYQVLDGDEIYVTADISPQSIEGETLIFSTNNLAFVSNQSFNLNSPFVSAEAFQIKNIPAAAGVEPIDGVLVYPQPARDIVRFTYDLTSNADVEIKIHDRNGVLLSEINETGKTAASRSITNWDATNAAPGVYFATIKIKENGGERKFKKKVYVDR